MLSPNPLSGGINIALVNPLSLQVCCDFSAMQISNRGVTSITFKAAETLLELILQLSVRVLPLLYLISGQDEPLTH